jgi:hypothetical protein
LFQNTCCLFCIKNFNVVDQLIYHLRRKLLYAGVLFGHGDNGTIEMLERLINRTGLPNCRKTAAEQVNKATKAAKKLMRV